MPDVKKKKKISDGRSSAQMAWAPVQMGWRQLQIEAVQMVKGKTEGVQMVKNINDKCANDESLV